MRWKKMDITQTITNIRQRYSQSNHQAIRNPWFIAIIGVITIFLLVNIIFVVFAVTSNPGLVVDDYYEKGREYEKNVITRLNALSELKWQTKFEVPGKIYVNTPDVYRFSATDSRGISIMDADVRFILYRPSDSGADFNQNVTQIRPGLYQTELSLPLPGVWDLTIKVVHGDDVYYHTNRIKVLAP
jgi:nitrogen fixation protein FixH